MKAHEYNAVVYHGEIYCNECLPENVIPEGNLSVHPIFKDSEWCSYPHCCKCRKVHNYMNCASLPKQPQLLVCPYDKDGDEKEDDKDAHIPPPSS